MAERNTRNRVGRRQIARSLDLVRTRRSSAVDAITNLYVKSPVTMEDGRITVKFDRKSFKIKGDGSLGVLEGSSALSGSLGSSPTTTKGDLLVDDGGGSPNPSVVRLGVGANGKTLVADSAETTGTKWADHDDITGSGTNTHSQIDTHIGSVANPHGVTAGQVSPLTTKGDLWGYSTVDARLPVGTNGHVLQAASGETLGVKWGVPTRATVALTDADSPYSVLATDQVLIVDASDNGAGGDVTVTLPAAATSAGRVLWFKVIDVTGAKSLTVDGNASETIDGATTKVLSSLHDALEIVCDGTEWWIL